MPAPPVRQPLALATVQPTRRSGRRLSDGPLGVEQIVCTIRDVDEAVRAEHRLQWEARHDPLTGLANRRVINETLQRVADDLDDPRRFVYFLDLDDFKKVNDALGHSAGDELLRTLAARITVLVQQADVVGRFGGDELIVVSAVEPERLAPRLLAAVHGRTMLAGSEFTVSCSIGAATVGAAEIPGDVIRRSNDAMYRAKRAGRNRYEVAGPLNTGPAQQRVELEASLRRAVAESSSELDMAFQPIVDRDLVPVAAEALLRWCHPTRGPLLPAEFLAIADSAGLMTDLGQLIMRRSVTAAASWAAAGHPLQVSVNVGGRQLGNRPARTAADPAAGARPAYRLACSAWKSPSRCWSMPTRRSWPSWSGCASWACRSRWTTSAPDTRR